MINKIVGYSAFQSYGQLPYSTLKTGQDKLQHDKIWESTAREIDNKPHIQNYHHYKSNYSKTHLENTYPQDYHPDIVERGSTGFKNYPKQNAIKTYERLESIGLQGSLNQNQDSLDIQKNKFLQTGVEHWKTNYKSQVDDRTKVLAQQNVNKIIYQPPQPTWSKNDFSHINNASLPNTDYKLSYGQKIGHCPKPHIMDQSSKQQPRIYNALKAGTTQLVDHIPGYQGFIPASRTIGKAFQQSKGEEQRTTFLKNNLIQNYHVQIPGYAGFKTQANLVNEQKLRNSCFRTNEFIKKQ